MPILITKYVIQYDPRLAGWVGFRVVKETEGHKSRTVERSALTNPKPQPHLAARALTRALKAIA